MARSEPPALRASSLTRLFRVGRDSRGNWAAIDQRGLCGGLFVDRAQALKFAMFENGNCALAVIMVPGILKLDFSGKPGNAGSLRTGPTRITPVRRVA
jgi:hypothetical protein